MITFKNFLLEDNSEAESANEEFIIDFIKQNCKEHTAKFGNTAIWRGIKPNSFKRAKKKSDDNSYLIMDVNKDRLAKDTTCEIHNTLNAFFKERFDVNARSETLFCTPSQAIAKHYSKNVYSIFAIGEVSYIWSPIVDDAFSDLNNAQVGSKVTDFYIKAMRSIKSDWAKKFQKLNDEEMYNTFSEQKYSRMNLMRHQEVLELMLKQSGNVIYNYNKQISKNTNSEVMLICDSYIAVEDYTYAKIKGEL